MFGRYLVGVVSSVQREVLKMPFTEQWLQHDVDALKPSNLTLL